MDEIKTPAEEGKNLLTWLTILVLTAVFLFWGLFIFFGVGVKWPPDWNFGTIPDVPGESVYSTYPLQPGRPGGSDLQKGKPVPQHVKEPVQKTGDE